MPTPSVIKQYQYSDAINRRTWDGKYFLDQFTVNPISAKVGGGAATGTAGDNNVLYTRHGAYEYFVIGGQTILAPSLDAFGLNLVQDVTSAHGTELCIGDTALSPAAFIIGTDAAFFIRAEFKVSTAAGINPLIVGFRKAQAFNATLSSYTDFAVIGIVGTANPNTIKIETQLASGGVTVTDTTQTWADAAVHRLKVLVSATGVVTYQVDDAPPTATAAFTFANATTVVPFVRQVQSATTTVQCSTDWLEIGYQS